MDSPIFYGLSLINLATLLTIGVIWSAVIWILTEAFRQRLGWLPPHSRSRRRKLIALSYGLGFVGTSVLFPWAWLGVGGKPFDTSSETAVIAWIIVIGLLGAASATASKAAHDFAFPLVHRVLGRVANFLGGANEQ